MNQNTLQFDNSLEFLREAFLHPPRDLEGLVNNYLAWAGASGKLRPSTLKGRHIYLEGFKNYLLRNNLTDISQVTNMDIDIFHMEEARRVSVHTGRQITTGTVNTSKRAVKAFLRWCQRSEIPLRARVEDITENRREDTYPNILKHKDIIRVIRRTEDRQDKLMVSIMYEAGLRIAEVLDFKIEHLRGRTIDVVGKGQKHRIVFITPKLANEIRDWMDYNEWDKGHVFRPKQHGRDGEGYKNDTSVRTRIERLFLTLAGVQMTPHKLRHAFALRLLKQGCSLRSIQKLLGHAKIETTMAYLNIEDDYLEKEYATAWGRTVFS